MVIVLFFFIQFFFFLGSSLWFKGHSDWPLGLAVQCLSWVLLPLFKELTTFLIYFGMVSFSS